MSGMNRFLGDTPMRVAIKLIVISFLVGIVMATFGWSPWDVFYRIEDFFVGLWNMGFDAIYRFWGYLVLGAAVVIPVFVVLRVVSYRR
jgi:polyferredoxin